MFGNNPVRKQDLREDGSLAVQEIFYTIQGEGPSAGRPAVFVRLAGCNLRCYFCDTDFESGMENRMDLSKILFRIESEIPGDFFPTGTLIVLTGGEPLRQNIVPLIRALEMLGCEVEIETAGTLWVDGLYGTNARIICSPKTRSVHNNIRSWASAWKYVVRHDGCSSEDGLPDLSTQRKETLAKLSRPRPGIPVYIQPMDVQGMDPKINQDFAVNICLKYGYRLCVQLHKIVGVE